MDTVDTYQLTLGGTNLFSLRQRISEISAEMVIVVWVNKGLGMSSRVCATGHVKDPVPLIEKSRASYPGGRFPPSFIYQVIIIT